MHKPQVQYMTAIMRILRYLKGTSNIGLLFSKNDNLDLLAYTDADWSVIKMTESQLQGISLYSGEIWSLGRVRNRR